MLLLLLLFAAQCPPPNTGNSSSSSSSSSGNSSATTEAPLVFPNLNPTSKANAAAVVLAQPYQVAASTAAPAVATQVTLLCMWVTWGAGQREGEWGGLMCE